MNEHDIINTLTRVGKDRESRMSSPVHREHLRHALLSLHTERQKEARGVWQLLPTVSSFTMKKTTLGVGAFAVVALVLLSTVYPSSSHVAEAQELAQKAYARAITLTPEMRAELEAKMQADMMQTLEEARNAPDLRILTAEEFKAQQPEFAHPPAKLEAIPTGEGENVTFHKKIIVDDDTVTTTAPTPVIGGEAGVRFEGVPADGKAVAFSVGKMAMRAEDMKFTEPVQYLIYTNGKGQETILGLDENETPVMKMMRLRAEDIIRLENGAIGIKATEMIEVKHVTPEAE